jgi:DNA processing protein
MSSVAQIPRIRACAECLRRSWLLSEMSGPLDYCARDRGRLLELLALPDRELLKAVAGRRISELQNRYECFQAGAPARPPPHSPDTATICHHSHGYPHWLSGPAAPHMLEVAGGVERLAKLTAAPVVAIVGSRAPSDYGMEMARSLARGLTASGVTVTSGLTDGIAVAVHAGALDANGASIAVLGGGLSVSCPARRRSLYERITHAGCAVSELPRDCSGRRWGHLAGERIIVELAQLTVLVEAQDTPAELAGARMAQALGRTLAAIPGRVSSPVARGPHALLMDGARLIQGPQDVLELLRPPEDSLSDGQPLDTSPARDASRARDTSAAGLPHNLRDLLGRVGSGCDTPEKLTRSGADPAEILLALSELELLGLLGRGDGGRYLPRNSYLGGETG